MSEIGRTKKESQRYTRATTSKPKHMVSICPLMLPQKHVDTTCGKSTRKGCDAILCCYYYLHKTTERPAVLDLHTQTHTTHTHTMYFIQLLRVSYVMESKITTAHFLFSWPNYLYANFGWSDSVASRTVAHKHTNTHRHLSQFWISLPMLAGKHAHTAAYKNKHN